jgi:hypothetical protein
LTCHRSCSVCLSRQPCTQPLVLWSGALSVSDDRLSDYSSRCGFKLYSAGGEANVDCTITPIRVQVSLQAKPPSCRCREARYDLCPRRSTAHFRPRVLAPLSGRILEWLSLIRRCTLDSTTSTSHPCKTRSYQSSAGDHCGDSSSLTQYAGDFSLNGYGYHPPKYLKVVSNDRGRSLTQLSTSSKHWKGSPPSSDHAT